MGWLAYESVVALFFELVGKLRATRRDDAAVGEDVHKVRAHIVQNALVVRNEHDSAVVLLFVVVDPLGHDPEGVDVESRVCLVENGELGLEQR